MRFPVTRGSLDCIGRLKHLATIPRKHRTLIIGVDGCGGSGKSTLAELLATSLPDITVVHTDDFFFPSSERIEGSPVSKPIGADCDWHRILRQTLEPLTRDHEGRYQPYDWVADRISDIWITVPVGGIVVVEGVYATRRELAELYDLRIWVECPRHIRLARGLHRDGEEARDRWENEWMVAEDLYVAAHRPSDHADLVFDGAGY